MFEVTPVSGGQLEEPLRLLSEGLGSDNALPALFLEEFRKEVEDGRLELLAAFCDEDVLGVLVISYGLSISAGGRFASIEELYVRPDSRRQGAGRRLLEVAGERCRARGVSYIEVQTVEDEAQAFYEACGYEPEEVTVMSSSYVL